MSSQKGFSGIILIILGFIIIGALYIGYLSFQKYNQYSSLQQNAINQKTSYDQQRSSNTNGWETFQNSKLNYAFNYPSNLEVILKEENSTKEDAFINSNTKIATSDGELEIFVSKVNSDYQPTPCEKTKRGCGNAGGGGTPLGSTTEDIEIHFGEEKLLVTKVTLPNGKITISTSWPIYKNQTQDESATFAITLNRESPSTENLFDQILSTFKFTN